MAIWQVSTNEKKSVEEHEFWTKDGLTIKRITGFRWGTFTIETSDDNPPEDIDPENPDGINMYDYFSDNAENGAELDNLSDGWYGDVEWPEELSEEERERLEELWEEESYSSWESDGWYNSETECWFFGELTIEKIGDSEPVEESSDDTDAEETPKGTWPF